MNGASASMQPESANRHSDDMTPAVVTVNFGLKARHIAMVFAAAVGLLTTAGTAGWLVLPAKQTDLARVEKSLDEIRGDLKATREDFKGAVAELTSAIKLLRVNALPPRPKPSKPKPKGIWD